MYVRVRQFSLLVSEHVTPSTRTDVERRTV